MELFSNARLRLLILLTATQILAQSGDEILTYVLSQHCGVPYGPASLLANPTYFLPNSTATSRATYSSLHATSSGGPLTPLFSNQYSVSTPFLQSSVRSTSIPTASSAGVSSTTEGPQQPPPYVSPSQNPTTTSFPAGSPTSSCIIATPSTISCPSSNGKLYTPAGDCVGSDNSYVVQCDVDYSGGGLTAIAGVGTAEDCIGRCTADATCIAVAFDPDGASCYERSSVIFGAVTASPGMVFAYNVRYAGTASTTSSSLRGTATSTTSGAALSTSMFAISSAWMPLSSMATPDPSALPVSQRCPEDDGKNVTIPDGTWWIVGCGREYDGTIYNPPFPKVKRQKSSMSPVDGCLDYCQQYEPCEGFTYSDNSCVLYSFISGNHSASLGSISARRFAVEEDIISSASSVSQTSTFTALSSSAIGSSSSEPFSNIFAVHSTTDQPSAQSGTSSLAESSSDTMSSTNSGAEPSSSSLEASDTLSVASSSEVLSPTSTTASYSSESVPMTIMESSSSSSAMASTSSSYTSIELSSSTDASTEPSSSSEPMTPSSTSYSSTLLDTTSSASLSSSSESSAESASESSTSSSLGDLLISISVGIGLGETTSDSSASATSPSMTSSSLESSISSQPSPTGTVLSQAEAQCPRDDRRYVLDDNDVVYQIGCSSDTTGGSIVQAGAASSFKDCFALCDKSLILYELECTSFAYAGGPDGVGGGTCYFKGYLGGDTRFTAADRNHVGGIRVLPGDAESSSTTTASTSASESSEISSSFSMSSSSSEGLDMSSTSYTSSLSTSSESPTSSSSSEEPTSSSFSTSSESESSTASQTTADFTSSSASMSSSATPTCSGSAEAAVCDFGSNQVRQAADGSFYLLACSAITVSSAEYLVTIPVSSPDAMGECVAQCLIWNAVPGHQSEDARCEFGIVYSQGNPACLLYSHPIYLGDSDAGASEQLEFNTFVVTHNTTLIAQACLPGDGQSSSSTSSTRMTETSSSASSSQISSSSPTSTCTSNAEDLVCASGNAGTSPETQVTRGADGRYYISACHALMAQDGRLLTASTVSNPYALGQCIAACETTDQCTFGYLLPDGQCDLFNQIVPVNDRDWGESLPSDLQTFIVTTNATLIAASCGYSGDSSSSAISTASSSSTSSASVSSSTATPSCTGNAEGAVCPLPNTQVRGAADSSYFLMSCSDEVGEANYYLTSLKVSSIDSMGECVAACVAWSADNPDSRCGYGQIWRGQEDPVQCTLWKQIVYPSGSDNGFTNPNSGRTSFIITTNATVIAGACLRDGSTESSSVTSTSSWSSSMTSSSTSSATPTCTGSAEDAVCPFTPDQTRKASDGLYYLLSCSNSLGGGNTFLGYWDVSSEYAMGECISACVAYNADPANAANPKCEIGGIAGPTECWLFAAAVHYDPPYNAVNMDPMAPAQPWYQFIVTSDATNIAGACAYPSQSSSTSSASPTPSTLCPGADRSTITEPDGSQWQIMCGYDITTDNYEITTRPESLEACIQDCDTYGTNAAGDACFGVTWSDIGENQPCRFKTAHANFENKYNPVFQSARRVCYPTVPECPAGDRKLYQSTDGSIFRLECNVDYPVSDTGAFYATSMQTCMDTCDQRGSTCAGAVYTPGNADIGRDVSCYLKDNIAPDQATQQYFECDTMVRLRTESLLATGAEVTCPDNNGATYGTADGSQFQLVCYSDFGSPNLAVFEANTFRVCMDLCAAYGPDCAGAAWTPYGNGITENQLCYLKYKVTNQQVTEYETHAFERIAPASFLNGQNCGIP